MSLNCIDRVGSYKDVKGPRVPGRTMKTQGVPSNDDVINLVFVEQLEQIFEVLLNFHGIDLSKIQWQRFAHGVSC
jgi:hypothetical protein